MFASDKNNPCNAFCVALEWVHQEKTTKKGDTMKNKELKQVRSSFFMYPCADGYKYAGFAHSLEETCNDFIAWALSRESNALLDIAYTVAIHTGNDLIAEYARVFSAAVDYEAMRYQMKEDGTLDALMHHVQVSDYPTC